MTAIRLLTFALLTTGIWAAPLGAGTVLPVAVEVPAPGLVSIGVYDAAGTLVRSLAAAQPVEPGPLALTWDATTDLGLPAAPGEYQVRGIWFERGPQVRLAMKVGVSGEPPYVQADGLGGWGGNLGACFSVAANAQQVLAAFGCVEDNLNTGVQLMDGDGRIVRRFHTFFPWDIRLAAALTDTELYLAVASIGGKRLVLARYALDQPRGEILCDIPVTGGATAEGLWKDRWTVDVQGLAAAGGRIYVPVTTDGRLVIVDAASGRILQNLDVPEPRGVAVLGDTVFLVSGRTVLKLDREGKRLGVPVAAGLEAPTGLAVAADGTLFVADGGGAQQVKVFAPDGALRRTIGRAGGRPRNGRFEPTGLLDPRSVCLGPGQRLWVAEANEDFQRVSVWDAASGALVKEFFNTRISSGLGLLSPDRELMLFTRGVYSDVPALTAYSLDFAKGTWYPAWNLTQPLAEMSQPDVFLGNTHIYGHQATAFGGRCPYLSYTGGMLKADNGRTYLFGGDFSLYLFDAATCTAKPAALIYTHRAHRTNDGRFEGDYDQGPHHWLTWADLDGDGRMTAAECTFTENLEPMKTVTRLFTWELQPDLSFLCMGSDWVVRRLRPVRVLESGVPVYDWATVETVVALPQPDLRGGDGWKKIAYTVPWDLQPMPDGWASFAEPAAGSRMQLGGVDGDGWWASRNWRQTPLLFDRGGQPRWLKLGRRAPGRARPGEMYYPRPCAGRAGGCVFVPDTLGQMWVWTDTGLYVGKLYREPWEKGPDADRIRVELVGAYVYEIDGKLYACAGDHGVAVHEVALPTFRPLQAQALTLPPEAAAAAVPWDPDGPLPGKRPLYTARSLHDFQAKKSVRAIAADGRIDAAEWAGIARAPVRHEGEEVGGVRLAFDQGFLYVAWDVAGADGLRNAGTELPLCPFVSGAYVDLCLGADWTDPDRTDSREGDVRVLLTRVPAAAGGATPFQIAYWPIKAGARSPQSITSPAATRTFAEIAPLPGLEFAVQDGTNGYTVEARLPWKALGLDPGRAATVGFDTSLGFADEAGRQRVRAVHWAGETEGVVVDRPGAAALKPETWGTLVLDRSPLPPAGQ